MVQSGCVWSLGWTWNPAWPRVWIYIFCFRSWQILAPWENAPYLKNSLLEPCSKPFARQLERDGIVFRGGVAAPKYKRICSSCAPLSSWGSFSWRCRAAFLVSILLQKMGGGWICSAMSSGTDSKLGMLFTEVCCDSAGRAEGHLPVNSSEI